MGYPASFAISAALSTGMLRGTRSSKVRLELFRSKEGPEDRDNEVGGFLLMRVDETPLVIMVVVGVVGVAVEVVGRAVTVVVGVTLVANGGDTPPSLKS